MSETVPGKDRGVRGRLTAHLDISAAPDPFDHPERYRLVVLKRGLALVADGLALAALGVFVSIFWVAAALPGGTTGLFALIFALWSLYYAIFVGLLRRSLGMARFALMAYDRRGGAPGPIRAFAHWLGFVAITALLGPVALIVPLLDRRRRFAHDLIAGVVVLADEDEAP